MKIVSFLSLVFIYNISAFSTTIIVDINGSGQYSSIQPAINAANVGDTIKILPGIYDAAISLIKDIIMVGSGYENTTITSNNNPTLFMNNGKIMWLTINSLGGNGISLTGGTVKNVVIKGCTGNGIYSDDGTASVINCAIVNNSQDGIQRNDVYPANGQLNVSNCISYYNGSYGYEEPDGLMSLSYSNGSTFRMDVGPGCLNQNPQFVSDIDLHLQLTSPCLDAGNTSMNDPDGTRSDMGYFGGTECPIYPVVTQIKIIPQQNGEIQIQAIGQANY